MKSKNKLLLAGIAFWMIGCATVPDDIGSSGLVVGAVCDVDPALTPHGAPYGELQKYPSKWIAGTTMNTLVVSLSPGTHTLYGLMSLESQTNVGTMDIGYVSQFDNYPIERTFSVEAGKATNLGLLVFRPKLADSPLIKRKDVTSYDVLTFDNTEAMSTMLAETYEKTFTSLKGITPPQVSNESLNNSELLHVREAVAQNRYQRQQRRLGAGAGYVTGCAGTIARLNITTPQSTKSSPASRGSVAPKILSSPTLADLSNCTVGRTRSACLISRSRYLSINGDTVTSRSLAPGMSVNSLYAFGDVGLVAVDDAMNIHTSRDDGATWTTNSEFAFKKPLERSKDRPDSKNRFGFSAGRDGYYVYGKYLDTDQTSIVYADYRTGAYKNLQAPKDVGYVTAVQETDAGVFISPRGMEFAKSKVYFLARGSSTWEARTTPDSACIDIAFQDTTGKALQVLCARDVVFRSADGGVTWERIFRADSAF